MSMRRSKASYGNRYGDWDRSSLVKRNEQTFRLNKNEKLSLFGRKECVFFRVNLRMENQFEIIHNMPRLFNHRENAAEEQ